VKYFWPEEALEVFVNIFLNVQLRASTNLCNVLLNIVGVLMAMVNESVMTCLQKEQTP
jgi:hypothetical protein